MVRFDRLVLKLAPAAAALGILFPVGGVPQAEIASTVWAEEDAAKAPKLAKVPDSMRGFSGLIIGQVVERDTERGVLDLKILKVARLWDGNKAKNAASGEGQVLRIEGITGKWIDSLLVLKTGDTIEIEANHIDGDSLTFIPEGFRKVTYNPSPDKQDKPAREKDDVEVSAAFPAGMRGFSGLIIGQVVQRDVERGVIDLKILKIEKLWRGNKAKNADSSVGKVLRIDRITGKWLDSLIVLKPGDTIEIEANHIDGDTLTFIPEGFRKVTYTPSQDKPARE